MSENLKKFIFITGCARSGTSTTTELIRKHNATALGRERYNSLFKERLADFNTSLFERNRFCSIYYSDDSHHEALQPYYETLRNRWDSTSHVGDKIPSLFKQYNYIFQEFPQAKIVFLLRNIMDVSQSWENRRTHSRATNGKWPKDHGAAQAVREWNLSIKDTFEAVSNYPNQIYIQQYEDLYREERTLQKLFEFISLPLTTEVKLYWDEMISVRSRLEENRTITLSSDQKRYISLYANFRGYKKLTEINNTM